MFLPWKGSQKNIFATRKHFSTPSICVMGLWDPWIPCLHGTIWARNSWHSKTRNSWGKLMNHGMWGTAPTWIPHFPTDPTAAVSDGVRWRSAAGKDFSPGGLPIFRPTRGTKSATVWFVLFLMMLDMLDDWMTLDMFDSWGLHLDCILTWSLH